ncbi:hypothetical protein GCM10027605_26360 [Micromonospora zhanjiangensis]
MTPTSTTDPAAQPRAAGSAPARPRSVTAAVGAAPAWVRYALLALGLVVALYLPNGLYPTVAVDILCWSLFAVAVDLLLGFTGLMSFGHAAFWGPRRTRPGWWPPGPVRRSRWPYWPGRCWRRCWRCRSAISPSGAPASTSRW